MAVVGRIRSSKIEAEALEAVLVALPQHQVAVK